MTPLTYLTFDSLAEGIGASQVLSYVERLPARGFQVELYSFEKTEPDAGARSRLAAADVRWHPQPFGGGGPRGGLARVIRGARLVRRAPLVHARSDLAAASALLGRCSRWLWDVRSFWADERIALGALRAGSPEERVLRAVEGRAADRCAAIVTLTRAAIPILAERHGTAVAAKARVVTTCVDLDRFALSPASAADPARLLISGTINDLYDVPTMIRFSIALAAIRPTTLHVLAPRDTRWHKELADAGAQLGRARPEEMPDRVAAHHAGLSIWRADAGVGLAAAAPTKLGEFLACGRPVIVNAGLGDMAELLSEYDCGVAIPDASDQSLTEAAAQLSRLLDDPAAPGRCRALAEGHFNLERAVDQLADTYRAMAG